MNAFRAEFEGIPVELFGLSEISVRAFSLSPCLFKNGWTHKVTATPTVLQSLDFGAILFEDSHRKDRDEK